MKKIWLITYHFDDVTAGPCIRFQRYAPMFIEKGYRLTFITCHSDKNLPQKESKEYLDVIRIKTNPLFLKHTFFVFNALLLALKNRKNISDVLTLSITTLSLWLIPLYKLTNLPLHYVNTMMVTGEYISINKFIDVLWNKTHKFLYRILYNNLNTIVCSTQTLSDGFKIFNTSNKNHLIINNGVNMDVFTPVNERDKAILRKKYNYNDDDLIYLFVGLKTERKGIKELADTWEHSKKEGLNAKLLLVGDEKDSANSEEFITWWHKYRNVDNLNNLDIYNLPGTNKIHEYFQMCDVFIFPSKKEGMPNVILEAMSCGICIIMNKFIGYSSDYGEIGRTHIAIELSEENTLKESILLCSNSEIRKRLSINARKHSINEFSVQNSINKYCNLFR